MCFRVIVRRLGTLRGPTPTTSWSCSRRPRRPIWATRTAAGTGGGASSRRCRVGNAPAASASAPAPHTSFLRSVPRVVLCLLCDLERRGGEGVWLSNTAGTHEEARSVAIAFLHGRDARSWQWFTGTGVHGRRPFPPLRERETPSETRDTSQPPPTRYTGLDYASKLGIQMYMSKRMVGRLLASPPSPGQEEDEAGAVGTMQSSANATLSTRPTKALHSRKSHERVVVGSV